MDLGLALPQYDYGVPGGGQLPWASVVECAQRAEAAGFASVWLADHLFLDLERRGAGPARYFGLEPIVALGALARLTTRVQIGTLVLCAPLRPPRVLAKHLATVDVLCGGRLTVGVGAGWYEPEHVAAGVPFERPAARLARLEATLIELTAMFSDDPPAPCRPAPLQRPRPPLWVGGRGDRLLGVVARHADGWNTAWTSTIEAYRERMGVLDRACEAVGRDPASVTLTVGLYALVGEDDADVRRRFERMAEGAPAGLFRGLDLEAWKPGRLVGTVDEVRAQLARWADLGVATVVVAPGAIPFSSIDPDDLDLLASAQP